MSNWRQVVLHFRKNWRHCRKLWYMTSIYYKVRSLECNFDNEMLDEYDIIGTLVTVT